MSLRLKRKFMQRPATLQEGEGVNPLIKVYKIYDGISFSIWDLIKAAIIGGACYGVFSGLEIPIKNATDGFLKGFAFGGFIGGLEDLLDNTLATILNTPIKGAVGTEYIIHELFQSILLQGMISGAVVAGISALGK